MPTPVSAFSPFTPFTPASSTHNSGGYFDRPTAGNLGIGSPLYRRPDLRSSGVGSSSYLRMSRVASAGDSPRQPSENGWRMASRMREEAWSAWEQQLGNPSAHANNNIHLSSDTLRISTRVVNMEESPADKRRLAVTDGMKTSSQLLRSPSDSMVPQLTSGSFRSISSNGLPKVPKLDIKQNSMDPSFFANRPRFHGNEKCPVN